MDRRPLLELSGANSLLSPCSSTAPAVGGLSGPVDRVDQFTIDKIPGADFTTLRSSTLNETPPIMDTAGSREESLPSGGFLAA